VKRGRSRGATKANSKQAVSSTCRAWGNLRRSGSCVGLQSRLMHPGSHGRVRQQQSREALLDQFGQTRLAQRLWAEAVRGLDLINPQFAFPTLLIEADQLEGGGLHGVEQGVSSRCPACG
jgi:hypothetical protein